MADDIIRKDHSFASRERSAELRFSIYRDRQLGWRWKLRNAEGRTIAESGEGFKAQAECEKAMKIIKLKILKAEIANRHELVTNPAATRFEPRDYLMKSSIFRHMSRYRIILESQRY